MVLVSRQMLEDSGLSSVDDALRRFAGLQLARNGGPGQSGGYFLRGVAAGGVVVLLDGVRIGSASLGQADFGAMDLAQIDHIEVVRGPVSGLYGADAVGGVVNLVTRRGKGAPRLQAHAALGGYRGREASMGVSGASGAIDYAASVGHEQNRGESAIRPGDRYGYYNPDRDGFKRTMGTVNVGVSPATGHRIGLTATEARLNAQYDSGRFDAATGLSDASPDFRRRAKTTSTALDYRGELSSRWITSAQLAHGVDDDRSGAVQPDHYRTTRNQATCKFEVIGHKAAQLRPCALFFGASPDLEIIQPDWQMLRDFFQNQHVTRNPAHQPARRPGGNHDGWRICHETPSVRSAAPPARHRVTE